MSHQATLFSEVLVYCLFNTLYYWSFVFEFVDNFFGSFSPDIGFWVAIVCLDVTQLEHAFEGASSNPFCSDLAKKAFHHVQP